jgi:hypothetical protein
MPLHCTSSLTSYPLVTLLDWILLSMAFVMLATVALVTAASRPPTPAPPPAATVDECRTQLQPAHQHGALGFDRIFGSRSIAILSGTPLLHLKRCYACDPIACMAWCTFTYRLSLQMPSNTTGMCSGYLQIRCVVHMRGGGLEVSYVHSGTGMSRDTYHLSFCQHVWNGSISFSLTHHL